MKMIYKLSREALEKCDFKNYETKKTGVTPNTRDAELLAELLKAVKKLK